MARGDAQLRIRLADGLRDHVKRSAGSNARTMNAEIVFRLERSFQENGPAEAATSPSRVTPQPMEKMMVDFSTDTPAAASPAAPGFDAGDAICDLIRVRHMLEMVDGLLDAPFGEPRSRPGYFHAGTLVDVSLDRVNRAIERLQDIERKGGAE